MQKSELRNKIKETKLQFSERRLEELSLSVMDRLLEHPAIKSASTVMLYHSLPDEVSTNKAIEKLSEQGKTVVLPVTTDNNGNMELRVYEKGKVLLQGRFGIMEPIGTKYDKLETISVAVIPGLAFDLSMHRLGHGKGYYDRFLTNLKKAYKIGICFSFQLLIQIPTDEHDVQMDEIITDSGSFFPR